MKIDEMSFNGEFAKQPDKILKAAVSTLGEDLDFVFWCFKKGTHTKKINLLNPSASEWFYLCRLLYVDLDSLSYGYVKRVHLAHIWQALKSGTYHWRKTPELETAIKALVEKEESNWQFQLDHTGDPLRNRIVKQWEEEKARIYIGKSQEKYFLNTNKLFQNYKSPSQKYRKMGKHVFRLSEQNQIPSVLTASLSLLGREQKDRHGLSPIK